MARSTWRHSKFAGHARRPPLRMSLVTVLFITLSQSSIYNICRPIEMWGNGVDSVSRNHERRELMMELLERKVRLRARQLYEERGEAEGRDVEDWVRAESEILKSSILAPLWNKRREQERPEAFSRTTE